MTDALAQNQDANSEDYKRVMSDPAVQEALVRALEKLPKMMEQYTLLEKNLDFAAAVMNDKASIQYLMDSMEKSLPEMNLNGETLHAIAALINKLPKLAQYVEYADKAIRFGQAVWSDEESVQSLTKGAESLAAPIVNKMQDVSAILEDAKRRASQDPSPIGMFTLLKLMKDPAVQSGLQFLRALLAVIEDRRGNSAAGH